ncbi:MAG: hypothetical protein ACLRSW_03520 [Christensenellaceae bacterium]
MSVSFDVMKEIQDNEYYKTIYEDKIEEGGTYGNFSVGKRRKRGTVSLQRS